MFYINNDSPRFAGGIRGNIQTAILTIDGESYFATVDRATRTWELPADTIRPLADGVYEVTASFFSFGGTFRNRAKATVTIDTQAPGIEGDTINLIDFDDDDGLINATEKQDVSLSATLEPEATLNSLVIRDEQGNEVVVAEDDITIDANGKVSVAGQDLSDLSDGQLTTVMTVTDRAGNTGTIEAQAQLDTSAEAGTVSIDSLTADNVISAAEAEQTITVSGTATGGDISAGDTVSTTVNGVDYSDTVQADGSWSLAVAGADLATATSLDVSVSSRDAAGNTVSSLGSATYEVSTARPPTPIVDDLTNSLDPNTGAPTGTTVNGVDGKPGTTIEVRDPQTNQPLGTAEVASDGSWSVDTVPALENGKRYDVVAVDALGNQSPPASVTGDTQMPGGDGDTTSIVFDDADGLINASEQGSVDLFGQVDPDATLDRLTISDGSSAIDIALNTVDVDAEGNLSVTGINVTGLNDGPLTATLTVTAANGATGSVSDTVTLDTTAPTISAVEVEQQDTDATADGEANQTVVSFQSDDPEASYEVTGPQGETASVTETPDGRLVATFNPALATDAPVTITATDPAGNVGTGNATVPGEITSVADSTAPDQLEAALVNDTGVSDSDRITKDGRVEVSTLEDGATLFYTTDRGETWQQTTDTGFTLPEGTYTWGDVRFYQQDVAGNNGQQQWLPRTVVDTTRPDQLDGALVNDTGISDSDRITQDGRVEVSTLEDGATLFYTTDRGETWQQTTDTGFTLAEGTYTWGDVRFYQVDAAGNNGAHQWLPRTVVDTTAPEKLEAALANDTGTSDSDRLTKDGRVEVSNLEDGATLFYTTDRGETWIEANGNSFTLAEGTYTWGDVRFYQEDAAGNHSQQQWLPRTVVDTTAPDQLEAALANDTGTSDSDRLTKDGRVEVSNLEDGATLFYTTDRGETWIEANGNSFTLAEGTYTWGDVRFYQEDAAGNHSQQQWLPRTVVDTTRPDQLEVALVNDTGASGGDKITRDGRIEVENLEAGATLFYTTDRGNTWNQTTDNGFTLAEGTYDWGDIRLYQQDAAGNNSQQKWFGSPEVVVDKSAHFDALGLSDTLDDTLTGSVVNVDAGQEVSLVLTDSNDKTQTLTATVDSNGEFQAAIDKTSLAMGEISVVANVSDLAGNTASAQKGLELLGDQNLLFNGDFAIDPNSNPTLADHGFTSSHWRSKVDYFSSGNNAGVLSYSEDILANRIGNREPTITKDNKSGSVANINWETTVLGDSLPRTPEGYFDKGGNVLAVNSATTGYYRFWRAEVDVKAGESYDFSFLFGLNVSRPRVIIDGNVIHYASERSMAGEFSATYTATENKTIRLSLDTLNPSGNTFSGGDSIYQNIKFSQHGGGGLIESDAPAEFFKGTTAPIVLDLNQDGELDYGTVDMDVNRDGEMNTTAWAGAEDGVLIWNKHGDGSLTDLDQYAFTEFGGKTDLEGLAMGFDSNDDGVFDAKDDAFEAFGAWQDADGNGELDAGEFLSLQELGITAIRLESDGAERQPSEGVQEFGRGTATLADGSEMLLADAAFRYTTEQKDDDSSVSVI